MSIIIEDFCNKKVVELLTEVAKTNGFTNYKIKNVTTSKKGDGYMGNIESAVITDDDDHTRVLNLIIKSAPKNDQIRNIMKIGEYYKREVQIYGTVLLTFQKLEAENGLSRSTFAPLLYSSFIKDKSEILVLEDLNSINYKMYERRVPMTKDHLLLVLTEYGRFHALSHALRDQKPNIQKLLDGLIDPVVSNLTVSDFLNNIIRQCKKAQNAFDENDKGIDLSSYKSFIESIFPWAKELDNFADEYSVILHGDCWTNNMMFKYEDETNSSKPTSVRFLDFQTARMGSPVLDVAFFFYSCCPKEALDNLDDYLQVYYNSFSDYLCQLGSDPNKMYPYSVFLEHWQRFSRYGLMMSMLQIHIMLTEQDEVPNAEEVWESKNSLSGLFDYEIKNSDRYYKRVKPIIEHFIEKKFI